MSLSDLKADCSGVQSAIIALSRPLLHQYWVIFVSQMYIVHPEMAIARAGEHSHAIAPSIFSEKSQLGKTANNSHELLDFKVLAQPQSTPWTSSCNPGRAGISDWWWPCCGVRPMSNSHCQRDSSQVCMLLSWKRHRAQVWQTPPWFPKPVLHLPCCNTISGRIKSRSGFLTSPSAATNPSLCWLQPIPMSHGHSSQKQPFTAKHCLINHPEKTTASLISPQPAPPLDTVQGHCTTSCRKHQTLTPLYPPLSKVPGSSTRTDEWKQRKYQQVLVYPLLVPESLHFAGDITATGYKEHHGVKRCWMGLCAIRCLLRAVPQFTAWFVCAPWGTGFQRQVNSPLFWIFAWSKDISRQKHWTWSTYQLYWVEVRLVGC